MDPFDPNLLYLQPMAGMERKGGDPARVRAAQDGRRAEPCYFLSEGSLGPEKSLGQLPFGG